MNGAIFLATLIRYFHVLVIMLLVFPPLFYPPGEWLKYIILTIPFIILSWHDGNPECSFTALEKRLKKTWTTETRDSEAPFFQPLLNSFLKPFNRTITHKNAEDFNYFLFMWILIICIIRYALFKNIQFKPKSFLDKTYVVVISILVAGSFVNYIVAKTTR